MMCSFICTVCHFAAVLVFSKAISKIAVEAHSLKLVVSYASHILVGVLYNAHHEICSLALVKAQSKSFSEPPDRWLSFERGKLCAKHKLDSADYLFRMGSDCKERLDSKLLKERVAAGIPSSHEHNHFVIQLEGIGLEFDTL